MKILEGCISFTRYGLSNTVLKGKKKWQ